MRSAPAEMLIRELSASDRAALAFSFRRLGAQSRFQRYLAAKKELTDRELDRMVRVDHWHHEALIAFSPLPRTPIGVSRYVRSERFDVAEIAVEVTDEWQRRGVGRALLQELRARAFAAGIRRFTATTLSENRGALALARELGTLTGRRAHSAGLELIIELVPPSTNSDRSGGVCAGWRPARHPASLIRAAGGRVRSSGCLTTPLALTYHQYDRGERGPSSTPSHSPTPTRISGRRY